MRCMACRTPIAGFGKRASAHVDVCDFCMKLARHDPTAIARATREGLDQGEIDYTRMRVRSAVHYAWLKRHDLLVGIRVSLVS
jgi:hypothetical protein